MAAAWNKGLKLTEEHKRKIALAQMGNKHALGYRRTEESIRRQVETFKRNLILHPEIRLKYSLARRGRKVSEETRRKMSIVSSLRRHTPEAKIKIGLAQKGKIVSEETIRKILLTRKLNGNGNSNNNHKEKYK